MRRFAAVVLFAIVAVAATLVLQVVWSVLLTANLATSPAFPWSAPAIAVVLYFAWQYASGRWAPAATREARRRYLRAGSPPREVFALAILAGLLSLGALIALWLVIFQVVATPPRPLIDMSVYPFTTVAVSLVTASLVGALTEEAGLRGYLLRRLEDAVPVPVAIAIAAVAIAPGHAFTQGFAVPIVLWYLVADVVFGVLAYVSGSILPGILVHAFGLLIFFTLIWPTDAQRTVVTISSAGPTFWGEVVGCVALAVAASIAFARLARRP